MEILRKPIWSITWEEVEAFCALRVPEGAQLDYKMDFSPPGGRDKGLVKDFAAFSNARGGTIILGVQEDQKTGLPTTWEGIDAAGKPEDRVHQYAAQVQPRPQYEVATTKPNGQGKVFVLIRIYEGDRPPYYVLNDANIHMRSGNITIQATPQETARLFQKKEDAVLLRQINQHRAEEMYVAAVERFQKRYKQWQQRELAHRGIIPSPGPVPKLAVGTFDLQPYLPNTSLVDVRELPRIIHKVKSEDQQIHANQRQGSWLCSSQMESIPDGGLLIDNQVRVGARFKEFQMVLATGFLFGRCAFAMSFVESTLEDDWNFKMREVVEELYRFINTAKNLYVSMKYQGGLIGRFSLSNLKGMQIVASNPFSGDADAFDILLSEYVWDIRTDTTVLFDIESRKQMFIDLINEIAWGFGLSYDHAPIVHHMITNKGWFTN